MNQTRRTRLLLILGAILLLMTLSRISGRGRNTAPSGTRTTGESDAARQAKAMKAYQDYQYVKYRGPISGPLYHSSKW